MRRYLISMAALGMMGLLAGCDHTAGVCDCDCGAACNGGGCGASPIRPGVLRPEPQFMPKENGDAKPMSLDTETKPVPLDAEAKPAPLPLATEQEPQKLGDPLSVDQAP